MAWLKEEVPDNVSYSLAELVYSETLRRKQALLQMTSIQIRQKYRDQTWEYSTYF